jgi:hypothetical protein
MTEFLAAPVRREKVTAMVPALRPADSRDKQLEIA